jgi:integrase
VSRPRLGSCRDCYGWGWLSGSKIVLCQACYTYARIHPTGPCQGCGRVLAVKGGYCRLCRLQLTLVPHSPRRGALPLGQQVGAWQLALLLALRGPRLRRRAGRLEPSQPPHAQIPGQLRLFAVRHDVTRFDRARHANPASPFVRNAHAVARQLGEVRGWSHHLLDEVDDALLVLLSDYAPGDRIAYSQVAQVDRLGLNVSRTAEVLQHLGVLDDDRTPAFDAWLAELPGQLASGIAADVHAWAATLRDGGPRSTPRTERTVRNYLRTLRPHLLAWSARYRHLREVTRDDLHAIAGPLTGLRRKRTLVALRSLFGFCKRHGRIFRDPTTHVRPGTPDPGLRQPLGPEVIERAVRHATTPERRLLLALAVVHAVRPIAMRQLTVGDVDLPNRRITIAGHARRLDDLTRQVVGDYLAARRRRWPHTANPHLLLNAQTGHDDRAVSDSWLRQHFKGVGVTLNQLRMDRQLEEALVHGPDALHLMAVFGIAENTAVRYANAARQLLESELEAAVDHDPPANSG